MAETVMPSVRGGQRTAIHLALNGGALVSAGLAGFAFGVLGQILTPVARAVTGARVESASLVIAIVGAALTLDLTHLLIGFPAPPTVGRQVPQEWGRLLPLPITAVLYGARLGVGPATILSTWLWWAALLAASTIGVWTAVAVSAWFALTRMAVNAAAGFGASPTRSKQLIRLRTPGWSAVTTAGLALFVAVALAGCGLTEPGVRPTLVDPQSASVPTIGSSVDDGSNPWTTLPAQLEDVVRTATPNQARSAADTTSRVATESSSTDPQPQNKARTDHDLSRLLPAELAGMTLVVDPAVDRHLTIEEAASIQPDPTEEIALLETRGYRGGWIRAFRSPTSDVAVLSVYEFRDEAEAEFYLEDGLITIGGFGGQFFDLPQLPAVRGFQQEADDGEPVRTLGGAFFHQNRWHLLYIVGDPATVTPDALVPALDAFYSSAVSERSVPVDGSN